MGERREVQGIQLLPCFPFMCPMQMYGMHLASRVMEHLTNNDILQNHQCGFRFKLLTETQLIEFTEDMLRGMNDRKQSDVVVMDFAKGAYRLPDLHKQHGRVHQPLLSQIVCR